MAKIITDRRVYLDADGALVEHGDPTAAVLWSSAGREVDAEAADQVGYEPSTQTTTTDDAPEPDDPGSCPVNGCDYVGTARGLAIHTGAAHKGS